jgi:hypothetical protein
MAALVRAPPGSTSAAAAVRTAAGAARAINISRRGGCWRARCHHSVQGRQAGAHGAVVEGAALLLLLLLLLSSAPKGRARKREGGWRVE